MYNRHRSGSPSTLHLVNESNIGTEGISRTSSTDVRRSELARFQPVPPRHEELRHKEGPVESTFGSEKRGWDLSKSSNRRRHNSSMSSGEQFITDLRESVASGRSNGRSKRSSRDRSRSRSHSRHRSSRGSKRSRSRSRDDRKRRERDRSEASQKSSQVSSSKSSSQRSTRERDDDSADSTMRLPFYLTQTPANIVVIKDLPKHCAEEDIRQEVEAFGAPIKNISIEQKSTPQSSRDHSSSRRVDPSQNTSLWAYLQFLRLEDAQRWMEQSQGRLRVRGEWVEMTYSEARTTSSRRSSRERHSSRKKGKRSRSSSRTNKRKRSRSRRRSRTRSRSGSYSRSTARRNRESREKSRERAAEREDSERDRQQRLAKDWDCFNCNGRNYPRRQECYRCGLSREESERSMTDLSLQQISSKVTKYLIIRELDALTTDETLHANLTRVSPVFIKQAYISRDPVLQVSNGYAYIELSNEADAEKLKAHLVQKNFTIDSKKVSVFFSKSCGDESIRGVKNSNPPSLYNEPKVQGVNKLSEEDLTDNPLAQAQQSSPTTEQSANYSAAPHQHQSAAAAQVTQTVNVNGQLYPVFPVPNTAQYVYDANSGYYYDHQTMLYYDANTRYYYNSTTQQFLYWDSNYSTYLPLPADKQQQKTSVAASNSTSTTATSQEQTPTKEGLTSDASRGSVSFTIGGKTTVEPNKKMDKNTMAKKVREDMERWTKSVNQLKRAENNRIFPVGAPHPNPSAESTAPGTAGGPVGSSLSNSESSESWGAASHGHGAKDIAFATLERRNMLEVGGDRPTSSNGNESEFKRVLLDTKPATALNPIGTFGHNNLASSEQPDGQTQMTSAQFYSVSSANSSSSNYNQPPVITEPKATVASEEVRLTDWVKMACLLCKRQFKDREALVKHQRMSDMHKSNMEQHMKTLETASNSISANGAPQSSMQTNLNEEEYDSLASMFHYRDRAKERREKHGISAPPLREYEKAYSSSSNQPAQSKPEEPIGSSNVGNKLMQAMGWKEGEGLGKSKQGITAPIKAAGRESTAGLGAVSYTRDPNKTYAENARQALLSRVKHD
ncbi:RNA-binding protein 5-like [Convolutriloba macropyga]|uniref:RNA-binding protein 5-like n=1 Tax=Convolutriloba macropyga TaxID=536237 RepID=UPI003F51DF32